MLRYLAKLGTLTAAAFFAITAVFYFSLGSLGNPVDIVRLGIRNITPAQLQALDNYFRPDLPIYERYFVWLIHFMTGDYSPLSVGAQGSYLWAWTWSSLELIIPALVVGGMIGIFLGVRSARTVHKSAGILNAVAIVLVSLPTLWLGAMALDVFSLSLKVLPESGAYSVYPPFWWGGPQLDYLAHFTLPFAVLAVAYFAILFKVSRAKELAVQRASVRPSQWRSMAWAAGAVGPVFALTVPIVFVVEQIFARPGLGSGLVQGLASSDLASVANFGAVLVAIVLGVNLVGKAFSGWVGPPPLTPPAVETISPRRLLRTWKGKLALVLASVLLVLVLWGALLAPYPARDFACFTHGCANIPPFTNAAHPLGTEPSGIDVFSDSIHGLSNDVGFAVGVAFLAFTVGSLIAYASSFKRPRLIFEGAFYIAVLTPLSLTLMWLGRESYIILESAYPLLDAVALGFLGALIVGYLARANQGRESNGLNNAAKRALAPSLIMASATLALGGLGLGNPTPVSLYLLLLEGFNYLRSGWWTEFFAGIFLAFAVLAFLVAAEAVYDLEESRRS